MRARTAKTFASLVALGLASLGAGACHVDVAQPPADDDRRIDPFPLPEPACAPVHATSDSVFTRTSGPDVARYRFVAATNTAIFASTGTSLHRSLDEGETWTLVDAAPLRGAQLLAVAAFEGDLFVSIQSYDGPGLFRSSDDGATWKVAATEELSSPSYLSSSGGQLFAQQFGHTFVWEPNAATWIALPTGDNGFDVIESDGAYLYANSIYSPGVYRLELAAVDAQWTAVTDLPEWGYRAFDFSGPHGFAANSTSIFETNDGGAHWKAVSTNAEVQDLLAYGGSVFAATSDGLRASSDGGATWATIGDQRFTTPFSLAATSGHLFSAGDDLRRATSSGAVGKAWSTLHPIGDAVDALVSTEGAILSTSGGHLLRSADGGASWTEILIGGETANLSQIVVRGEKIFALRHPGSGGAAILMSEDDGQTFEVRGSGPGDGVDWVNFLSPIEAGLIAGVTTGAGSYCQDVHDTTTRIYESFDDGATWVESMNHFPTTFTDCYGETYTPGLTGVSQANGVFFAESFWKGTYRSANGGESWAPIDTPETIGALRDVVAVDGALLAVAGKGGLARSADDGLTWSASGLSGLEVASLVRAGDVLYASVASADPSVAGVYSSVDGGTTWARVDGAFDARVGSIAVQGGKLFAGTLDESVWAAPLSCEK
ncbi:MAG: hypothetical protein U0414_39785 [Polyangiaceae bacterium]